jgi:light-regulated signal transduction histidine kinase (bacteriophytochrome)
MRACVVEGQPGARIVCRHLHADGSWRTLECIASNRLDDPAVGGIIVTSRDVTEREEAARTLAESKAELERSNAELQQFAYVASHDLQEPLRTVQSYLGLLRRRYQGQLDADADEFIGYAVDGAARMQALINDVLAFSRVGTRGEPFAPTDCAAVVRQTLAQLGAAIEERQARVNYAELPTVLADASQLGQVFQNLIANALKFCRDAPPEIDVTARRIGDEWHISVRDNGIGLAPEYAERIFVIFQRLHTRDEYAGTGIGLAICKRIVERHGGRIWVESQPGHGATFFFTLPAADIVTAADTSNLSATAEHAA